jgi:hypothetical protein
MEQTTEGLTLDQVAERCNGMARDEKRSFELAEEATETEANALAVKLTGTGFENGYFQAKCCGKCLTITRFW